MKNLGEKGSWSYPGTAQIFEVLSIIPGSVKATKFEFGRYIWYGPSEQKPIKNFGKKECGRIQRLPKISQYPLLSQERESYEVQILYTHS